MFMFFLSRFHLRFVKRSDTDDRIVGLIGNVLEITPGHHLTAGTATCDGLGFMLITVLWTEHVWTLCLAVGTYLILIHVRPLSIS